MMICEKCKKKHDGSYGSGRFCSEKCSRYRSKACRKKISALHKGIPKSDEWKKKVSKINTGRKMTKEQIQKRIAAGYKCSKKRNKKISNSLTGTHHTDLHKQHERLAAIKRISNAKFNGLQMFPSFNTNACKVIDDYGKENGYCFQHALNGGEFYIKELGYWVDGYDKEKNVVIEYYEKHHNDKKIIKKDIKRKYEIINFLGCKFIELLEE
jgi:hypothetical protein